jgi:hypothetical protein
MFRRDMNETLCSFILTLSPYIVFRQVPASITALPPHLHKVTRETCRSQPNVMLAENEWRHGVAVPA